MNKVIANTNVMEKEHSNLKKYKIRVSPKDNGYQARTTLDLGGVVKTNPRPECYSIASPKEAVNRLVEKIQIILSNYTTKRIKLIGIEEPDIIYYVLEETNEVPKITFKKPILVQNDQPKVHNNSSINNLESSNANNYTANPNIMYSVTNVGYTWFNAILERTKKNPDEEEYLANKTAESYIYTLKRIIIPFFKGYTDIRQVDEDSINEMLTQINGKTQKKDTLTVAKLFFSFAKKNKYIKFNPTAEITLPRKRKQLDEIEFIEEKDREKWIYQCF